MHEIQTTVNSGQSEYIITNTSDIYYVYANANTNKGYENISQIIDFRPVKTTGEGYIWSYGSFVMPAWVYNTFSIFMLLMVAGIFGAYHRGEGAIITGFIALFFGYIGWLTTFGATMGFLSGLVVFAVLYHLESKRRQGGNF